MEVIIPVEAPERGKEKQNDDRGTKRYEEAFQQGFWLHTA
jgi:hypothetical protein